MTRLQWSLCQYLYLKNHRLTLIFWVSNLISSLCLLALPTESLCYTILKYALPQVQPIFLSSTYRITTLHYTYGCATLSAAYLSKFYIENDCVTLHLWVAIFMCRLCLLVLPGESLCYTARMGALLYLQPILLRCTERITVLRCTSGCPT